MGNWTVVNLKEVFSDCLQVNSSVLSMLPNFILNDNVDSILNIGLMMIQWLSVVYYAYFRIIR